MAIYHEDIVAIELSSGSIHRSFLNHSIGSGDAEANRFGVRAFRNGEPENIGGTCMGLFIRADGTTVTISSGVVIGNVAYVTLPEACYAVEGNFTLAIKVSGSGVTGTMRIVDGVVSRTSTNAVVDPGTIIPSIEDLIDAIDAAVASVPAEYDDVWTTFAPNFSSSTAYSKGQYVTYNGTLYKFTADHAAGSWSGSDVTAVNTGTELKEINDGLIHIEDAGYLQIPVKGSVYVEAGAYVNGTKQVGAYTDSCHFVVAGMSKIFLSYVTGQYYDIYTFLDESMNVLEYKRELETGHQTTVELYVPEDAYYVVANGPGCASADVTGFVSVKHGAKELTINPCLKKNAFVNTSSVFTGYQYSYLAYVYDVRKYDYATIKSKAFQFSKGFALGDRELDLNIGESINTTLLYQYGNNEYEYTEDVRNADYLVVSVDRSYTPTVKAYGEKENVSFENAGFKKIVWYGTSIPAAGFIGEGNDNAYPARIGKIIGANVINKAVGSSSVVCKDPNRISAGNPYGFTHDFELCSRCLTNTVEEMQWIIDHFDDTSVFDYRTVTSLSDQDKQNILSFSYENRLVPYLTSNTEPDMFVFDHGFNENTTLKYREDLYDKKDALEGTELNGWYLAGNLQQSAAVQSVEFDCTDYDYVVLNGTIGAYYDVYDLFNGNTYVSSERNLSSEARVCVNYMIDTHNATRIIISAGSAELVAAVSVGGLPYGDPDKNLYSYRGAMGFLFNLIFTFDPRAKIVMIGNYCNDENTVYETLAECQEFLSDHWDIPLYRQWEFYGWSNRVVSVKWLWNNGYLIPDTVAHTGTVRSFWFADGVHPHTDLSGRALQYMADHIAAWIMNSVWSQYQY